MITIVDTMEGGSGWTGTDAAVHGINEHREYIADWLDGSVVFSFVGGSIGKVFDVNIAGSRDLVFSVWSRNKSRAEYGGPSSYDYTIEINGEYEWFLPVYLGFNSVTIELPDDVEKITSVEFSAVSASADWLVVSALYVVRDEYPLDIMQGCVKSLGVARDLVVPVGIPIGTVSAEAGDTVIDLTRAAPYVERYSVVKIADGTNTEFHQVGDDDGGVLSFTQMYDGQSIAVNFTDANVSLWFPVEFSRYEVEAAVPAIVVYAMTPEPTLTTSELAQVYGVRRTDGKAVSRREPMALTYPVVVACESRAGSVHAVQNRVVREWLGSNVVWINGRKHDIEFEVAPVSVEPINDDLAMKSEYTVRVEVREDRGARVLRSGVVSTSLVVTGGQA